MFFWHVVSQYFLAQHQFLSSVVFPFLWSQPNFRFTCRPNLICVITPVVRGSASYKLIMQSFSQRQWDQEMKLPLQHFKNNYSLARVTKSSDSCKGYSESWDVLNTHFIQWCNPDCSLSFRSWILCQETSGFYVPFSVN